MDFSKITNHFHPKRILDIGANVGQFHQDCKQYFKDCYVYSVEASEECEQSLKEITDQYYIGLLAKDDSMYEFYTLNYNKMNTGNSIYRELTDHYFDYDYVEIVNKKGIKLDDLFDANTEFDLIKIDTQGSELDIISGGIELCKRAKGILLEVSLTRYNVGSPLYEEVIEFMDNIGFKKSEILHEVSHPVSKDVYLHQQDILFTKK